ncbi:threonylcarbamoyl-AMP synthase [Candidatus Dojkabacteria bacterium]|nr:threonylcarbamoyl-AMP synthase [Candidatus Dojkabacteria bacterium]
MEIISHKDPDVINRSVQVLKDGGVLVYPTETCYGLGVDSTNKSAVDKLLKYKARREGKPLSIAVSGKEMASEYVEINEIADNLYDNYLPGPITVVSRGKCHVAEGVESEYGTLGIRVPDYPLILEIVKRLGKPITATSANVSYQKRPYSINDLLEDLPKKQAQLIDLIINAGTLPKNDVSTVVDTTLNTLNIMRQGKQKFKEVGLRVLHAKTKSAEDTINLGSMIILKYLNDLKFKALLIALGGELGSGKTQLTKGIARQLQIDRVIKSPTYTLISEYQYSLDSLRGDLIHIDTWRLGDEKEFNALNLENFIKPQNVIVVEWADKFYNLLSTFTNKEQLIILKVRFKHLSMTEREIIVELV